MHAPSMQAQASALVAYFRQAAIVLQCVKTPHQVEEVLHSISDLLLFGRYPALTDQPTNPAWQQLRLQALLLQQQDHELLSKTSSRSQLQQLVFYWFSYLQTATVLLSGVLPDGSRHVLSPAAAIWLDGFFTTAPAPVLLTVLTQHLSQISSLSTAAHSFSPSLNVSHTRITALGSNAAVGLLSARFLHQESHGLAQLLIHAAAAGTVATELAGATTTAAFNIQGARGTMSSWPRLPRLQPLLLLAQPWPLSAASSISLAQLGDTEHWARLLASLPDLAANTLQNHPASTPQPALGPSQYICRVSLLHAETCYGLLLQQLLYIMCQPLQTCQAAVLDTQRAWNGWSSAAATVKGINGVTPASIVPHELQTAADTHVPTGTSSSSLSDGTRDVRLSPEAPPFPPDAVAAVHACAQQLTVALLEKVVLRGYARVAATCLIQNVRCNAAGGSAVGDRGTSHIGATMLALLHASVSPASDKLVIELLLVLGEEMSTRDPNVEYALSAEDKPTIQAAGHGADAARDVDANNALAVLCQLLPPRQALQSDAAQLRYLMTDKLLTQRTLPSSALHLLLDWLQLALAPTLEQVDGQHVSGKASESETFVAGYSISSASTSSTGSSRADRAASKSRGSRIVDTSSKSSVGLAQLTAQLAAIWADPVTISRTSVPLQAYLTHVLFQLLQRLGRSLMDSVDGLMTSVLGGISERLSSPLPATQYQAMRVGRAFSSVLDAGSTLFGDQGPLRLGADEVWPGAIPLQQAQQASLIAGNSTCVQHNTCVVAAAAADCVAKQSVQSNSSTPGHRMQRPPTAAGVAADVDGGGGIGSDSGVMTNTDSDDDQSSSSDEEGPDVLQPLDMVEEDVEADAWKAAAQKGELQLRAVAIALRKQDDVSGVLTALQRLEALIRAAPSELAAAVPELARSLLHCRLPEWAETDAGVALKDRPQVQKFRCLIALLSVAPLQGGDALLREVYSPHLDTYQRMLILDTLSAAAQELSNPGLQPALLMSHGGAPTLVYPGEKVIPAKPPPLPHALQSSHQRVMHQRRTLSPGHSSSAAASHVQPLVMRSLSSDGGSSVGTSVQALSDGRASPATAQTHSSSGAHATGASGKTRVWGHAALRRLAAPPAATHRNRFADVAVRWATALLREVDHVKHGTNLFERDSLVLGRLLATLGTFVECCGDGRPALPLAAATLELLKSPQVHGHREAYVRRAALLAVGQVVGHIPPSRVAAAMLGVQRDATDAVLVERLQWAQEWTSRVAAEDVDEQCRRMAEACVSLQGSLGSRALEALQAAPSGSSGPGASSGFGMTLPDIGLRQVMAATTKDVQLPWVRDVSLSY